MEYQYQLPVEAAPLADYISDISEATWHSKWLDDIEFYLWELWDVKERKGRWALLTDGTIEVLRILSEKCQGWVYYHNELAEVVWVPKQLWVDYIEKKIDHAQFLQTWNATCFKLPDVHKPIVGLVKPHYQMIDQYKKEFLFFDKLAVIGSVVAPDVELPERQFYSKKEAEFARLVDAGFVAPASYASRFYTYSELENSMVEELKGLDSDSVEYTFKRMCFDAEQLANRWNVDVVPIISDGLVLPAAKPEMDAKKIQILKVMIDGLAEPSADTEWERLIDFKRDTDAIGKLYGLRTYISGLAKEEKSVREIAEAVEWQLYQYGVQMERHKIRNRKSVMEKIIVTTGEVAENLIKLNFGKAAKVLFDVRRCDMEYRLHDSGFVGHELAYLHDAKKILQGP